MINTTQKRHISVMISTNTPLEYKLPSKFGIDRPKEIIYLANPYQYKIDHGRRIRIGNNQYAVVHEYVENISDIPKHFMDMCIDLCSGTVVLPDTNGLPIALGSSIVAVIPPDSKIILPAKTKLQQIDTSIRLTLETDVEATIVPLPTLPKEDVILIEKVE